MVTYMIKITVCYLLYIYDFNILNRVSWIHSDWDQCELLVVQEGHAETKIIYSVAYSCIGHIRAIERDGATATVVRRPIIYCIRSVLHARVFVCCLTNASAGFDRSVAQCPRCSLRWLYPIHSTFYWEIPVDFVLSALLWTCNAYVIEVYYLSHYSITQ